MNTRFLMPMLAALSLMARASLSAQEIQNFGDIHNNIYNKVYEFPKQKFSIDGKDLEARATIKYLYDAEKKEYEHLILEIKVLPLSVEGFSVNLCDSIAKYARAGTAIQRIKVAQSRRKVTFKGSADMYTIAFSTKSDNRDAQATLKYSIKFDCEKPDACVAKFKAIKAAWGYPDKREHVNRLGRYFSDSWKPELHYMGDNTDYLGFDSIFVMKPEILIFSIPDEEKESGDKPMVVRPKKIYGDIWWCAELPISYTPNNIHSLPVILYPDAGVTDGSGNSRGKLLGVSSGRSLKVCNAYSLLCSPRNKFAFMEQSKSTWIDYRTNLQGGIHTYKRENGQKGKSLYLKDASITILLHY